MVKPKPQPAKPTRPPREIISAEQWEIRLTALSRMSAAERREYRKNRPAELSLDDLRSECIALIKNEFAGMSDEDAFEIVHARGGATPQTLRRYRDAKHWNPRATTIQASLYAVGWELGPRRRRGVND